MTGSALVPTGRQMKSYACMRSLARRGVRTVLAADCEGVPHRSSRYCDESVTVPAPREDPSAFVDALLELAAREDVETIYPTREADVFLLAQHRDRFERHVSLPIPTADTLETVHDRLRLFEAARDAGVGMPETQLLSDVDAWDADRIVKSRFNVLTAAYVDGFPDDEIAEVKSVRHLQAGVSPDLAGIRATMRHEPIVQAFVPKREKYMVCALYDHGECLATYQHEEIRGNSWIGGGGVYRKSTDCPDVEAEAVHLLDHVGWHGLACLEYIRDANTGEWKLLEINPKLWQSLPSTIRANADFPYYYWLQARGRPGAIDPSYTVGVGCHMLYGELAHLASIVRDESPLVERPSLGRTTWDVLRSCLEQPRFDYLHRDDPKQFLDGIRAILSSGGSDDGPIGELFQ